MLPHIDYVEVAIVAFIAGACWTLGAWLVRKVVARVDRNPA